MIDRRILYINPNGRIPPPGGGNQLPEEFKAPALSDLQKERLPAMTPLTVDEPPMVAAVKSTPGMSAKMSPDDSKNGTNTPEPASLIEGQEERVRLEDSEAEEEVCFSEGDGRNGIAGHSGLVLTFERVEALRPMRADSREKTVNALRQLAESVSSGDMPWELLQADCDWKTGLAERSGASGRFPGSRETSSRRTDQLAEMVVPLAEGIVRGRALVACPGWFLLMLLFLAASGLALSAEQGFLHAGLLTHFLDSKAWTFTKLALIFSAALVALRGFFFSLFTT
jgi:hypothetical protein